MKRIFFFAVLFLFCHAAIAQDTLQLIPKKWSFADGNGRMTKYVGQGETLKRYNLKAEICEKGYRNNPLTEQQKESNRVKSSVRSRVEHVFGFMEGAMHGLTIRTIGFARAVENIFMKCLVYNLFRYEQIVRYGLH